MGARWALHCKCPTQNRGKTHGMMSPTTAFDLFCTTPLTNTSRNVVILVLEEACELNDILLVTVKLTIAFFQPQLLVFCMMAK